MTELNDHLKLLFARAATLICRGCGRPVTRDNAAGIFSALERACAGQANARGVLTFPVPVPKNFKDDEVRANLEAQGYTRVHGERVSGGDKVLDVVQDRFKWDGIDRQRVMEAIESALRFGGGRVDAHLSFADGKSGSGTDFVDVGPSGDATRAKSELDPDLSADSSVLRFSDDLHCAHCDIHYAEPNPSTFSFNSPLGAVRPAAALAG